MFDWFLQAHPVVQAMLGLEAGAVLGLIVLLAKLKWEDWTRK